MNKVTQRRILQTWWPLAASWLLMSAEGPVLNGFVARMINPEINLAASGGVVLPISFIIEAPIIMLLSASTALGKDWPSYLKLRKVMLVLGAALTVLHILVAFTPVYDFLVVNVMGVPQSLIEPARAGLRIMTPWTFFIGLRRFNQGLMIRYGRSDAVAKTSMVRLATIVIVMLLGYRYFNYVPGVILSSIAQVLSVTFEGLMATLLVRPVLPDIKQQPLASPALDLKTFQAFYIPLVLTSLLSFLGQPIGSSLISRMPNPVESLAIWAVVGNLMFITRSPGLAFNEVVVALLDEKGSAFQLGKFGRRLTAILFFGILIMVISPMAYYWFNAVSGLTDALSQTAVKAVWVLVVISPLSVLTSWFQGNLVHSRKTTGVSESVLAFILTLTAVLMAGVVIQKIPGVYVAAMAFTAANLVQTGWQWFRSRKPIVDVYERDRVYQEALQIEG